MSKVPSFPTNVCASPWVIFSLDISNCHVYGPTIRAPLRIYGNNYANNLVNATICKDNLRWYYKTLEQIYTTSFGLQHGTCMVKGIHMTIIFLSLQDDDIHELLQCLQTIFVVTWAPQISTKVVSHNGNDLWAHLSSSQKWFPLGAFTRGVEFPLETQMTCVGQYEMKTPIYKKFTEKKKYTY